jgi:hypothetical protein
MRKLTLAAAVIAALSLAAQASAGGYAGSGFEKSECSYTKETNTLYCVTTFTTSTPNATATIFVNDPRCAPSRTRVFQRTGTLVQEFRAWATFTGHAPVANHEIAGNESAVGEGTWENFTDVDLGCLV